MQGNICCYQNFPQIQNPFLKSKELFSQEGQEDPFLLINQYFNVDHRNTEKSIGTTNNRFVFLIKIGNTEKLSTILL